MLRSGSRTLTWGARLTLLFLGVQWISSVPVSAQDLESAVQESYATNLVLLRDATKASVAELFMGFSAPTGVTLLVEPDGDHQANWFVENHILSHLTVSGYQAYLKGVSERPGADKKPGAAASSPPESADVGTGEPTSLADAFKRTREMDREEEQTPSTSSRTEPATEPAGELPDYVLRYRVVHFEVSYPKNYRTSPLGSRKVQRRVSVSIQAHLLRGAREDVVWVGNGDVERLDVVPASKLSLLEGSDFPFTQPELKTKGLSSLVEPALVSGIVAGLIYLFYTNQD